MANKILFVDDEKDILSSMRRLLMEERYEILTAESGLEALELLKKGPVDLIVSDQRMPRMSGVEFLQRSKEYSPDSIRIVLTGYADTNVAIDSINKGDVYRYITKPWNDDEIRSTIRNALELGRLRQENNNLLQLTQKQNLELKDLNENLEEKVKAQTKEIQKVFDELKKLYGKLDESFMNSVRAFSNITSLREKTVSFYLKNASKLAKMIAQNMGLSESEIKDIEIAALLHDIGTVGIADNILNKPFDDMNVSERARYKKHTILGQAALQSIENLQNVGVIIRHHHERWDGKGYPDNIGGEQIPIGSRIISIISDYHALLNGTLTTSKFTKDNAKQFIKDNSNQRYGSEIVELFIPTLTMWEKEERTEFKVPSSKLKAGMVLSMDVYTASGLLLLNEGIKLTEELIKRIIGYEKSEEKEYVIYITTEKSPS